MDSVAADSYIMKINNYKGCIIIRLQVLLEYQLNKGNTMTYTYKTLHTLGGTCDRCGKGIKNVVVLNDGAKDYEIGTDCAIKVLYMGGEITPAVKRTIDFALKAAKDLSKIQQLKASNELQTKFVVNDSGDKIYYWFNPSKTGYGWKWLGLACQNKEGLYKEIWDIVTTA